MTKFHFLILAICKKIKSSISILHLSSMKNWCPRNAVAYLNPFTIDAKSTWTIFLWHFPYYKKHAEVCTLFTKQMSKHAGIRYTLVKICYLLICVKNHKASWIFLFQFWLEWNDQNNRFHIIVCFMMQWASYWLFVMVD